MLAKKILTFCLFCLALLSAELKITSWQQRSTLSPQLIDQEIKWVLSADLVPNAYHDYWSFIFDPLQKISIREVLINGQKTTYEFNENNLKINFQKIFSGQSVEITLRFQEIENNNHYYIQQYCSIPNWAQGAKGKYEVILADDYDICGWPIEFVKSNNKFQWQGIVPPEGLSGLFQYTARQAHWKIKKTIVLSGSGTTKSFEIYLPSYFKIGQSKVLSAELSCQPKEINSAISGNYQVFTLRSLNNIFIELHAELLTGKNIYNFSMPLRPAYQELPPKTLALTETLVKNILSDNDTLPPHISLANWVHSYLTYDYGYQGRKMTVPQIFTSRKGVCEHYAQLYIALCRTVGLPALELTGYAYSNGSTGAPQGWGPHSWVLVYADGKWIQIDPTWGLTSGVLPVSHIAFYCTEITPYSYMLRNYYGRIFVDEQNISIEEIQ